MMTSNEKLFQQNTDLEVIELLLPYLTSHYFLDIGAAKGEFTRFFSQRGLKGAFFEPLSDCKNELAKLAIQAQCNFFPYAIDDHDHQADFYQAFDKNNEDVMHFSSLHPLIDDTRINHKKTNPVQCRSIDSLLKEDLIPHSVGIIKIDTEGNDLNVLKGMSNIKTEILMCEYFMPKIYKGWQQGHPEGLIQEAKKLGFNHCLSIKRIGITESIAIDNNSFIDKQWGNLIFISDPIYEQSKNILFDYVKQKEKHFMNTAIMKFAELQEVCDARQVTIDKLQQICDERLDIIKKLSIKKAWFHKIKLKIKNQLMKYT